MRQTVVQKLMNSSKSICKEAAHRCLGVGIIVFNSDRLLFGVKRGSRLKTLRVATVMQFTASLSCLAQFDKNNRSLFMEKAALLWNKLNYCCHWHNTKKFYNHHTVRG